MPLFGGPPDIDKLEAGRDVPGLIKALGYQKDPNVRQLAARALGLIGDARAVEALAASLGDQDWRMRQSAAMALGKIGDPRAVGPLVAALDDGWTRWFAVLSLGQIGDPAAVGPVIAALHDPDKNIRTAAASALARLRDARAVEPLISVLRDADGGVRTEAIRALERLSQPGDARAVEPLMAILRKEASGRDTRAAAAGVLAPIAALVAIGAPAVAPLLGALEDVNDSVRIVAAEALGQFGDPRAVEPLIAALKDQHPMVRKAAAESLGRLAWYPDGAEVAVAYWLAKGEWQKCVEIGAGAVEPLAATLEHKDYWVRAAAAMALGEIGDPRGVKPLVDRLSDQAEDLRVREAAAEALGKSGDQRAVEPLLAVLSWASDKRDSEGFLRHEDDALHTAVAWALGKIGTPAVAPFMDAFRDWDWSQRLRAVDGLDGLGWQSDKTEIGACYWAVKRRWDKCAEIGSPAVETLILFLGSHYGNDRRAAAEALVRIGAVAVEPLIAALADGADYPGLDRGLDALGEMRRTAAEALGLIGDARAVGPLVAALQDKDKRVGRTAAAALDRMGVPETQRSAIGPPSAPSSAVAADRTEER